MSETHLLDVNVLVALSIEQHIHHRVATTWFGVKGPKFATCPITQGALVRFCLRTAVGGASAARELLKVITALPGHEFWPDDLPCSLLPWGRISGHKQVTDAYLVGLAEHNGGRLATFDASLAAIFPEARLIPFTDF